jgi:hypothetical protein
LKQLIFETSRVTFKTGILCAVKTRQPCAIKSGRGIRRRGNGAEPEGGLWGLGEVKEVAAEVKDRPFDVPWLVLDSALAARTWDCKPQTPLAAIWTEIAEHADKNPDWLDATAD